MYRSSSSCVVMALSASLNLLAPEAMSQEGPETRRCLTREQLNIEPIFSACPPLIDEASVADNSFVARLNIDGGPSRYTMRWAGPGYFNEDIFEYNEATGFYDGICGTRACSIGPGGWVQMEHWDYFVGTLLAENVGVWTYEELHDDALFQSRTFEVNGLSLKAVSGAQQTGIVDQPLPEPLVLRLASFEQIGIGNEVIGWSIDGPRGAKGAAVYGIGSGSETDADGVDAATVRLGSKAGTYTVTLNNRRLTADSQPSFTFTAIDDIADTNPVEDHPEVEEGVGEVRGQRCDSVGNPITLSIGNKFQREVDLAPNGISPIEFVRYHNSLGYVSRSFAGYWTHTYDRSIAIPDDPRSDPVKVIRPDGRKLSFNWDGAGYRPAPGIHSRLEETTEGWRFVDEDSAAENFDADGRLVDISDIRGRIQTTVYDSRGNLTRIESNTGNSIDLSYDGGGRIATLTDQAGRTWGYRYGALGRLAQVDNPDGTTREYHYEDLRHAYALTGITIENGERFSWYEYDEHGRATASYHANDADRVDVHYDANGDRVVLDPMGNATVYRTRIQNRRGVLDGISGPICSEGCGQSELNLTYDANMNVASKTAYGTTTEFGGHDDHGRPGYAVFAAGTPDAKRVDYAYDERFLDRVTRIVEPSVYEGRARTTERSYDGRGNVLSETISGFDPFGQPVTRTTTHAWDGPLGQLSASDGPRSDVDDVTRYEYYPDTSEAGQNRARLRTVIDANGNRIRDEITYTATGKIRSERRPNGSVLSYDYYPGNDRIRSLTESGDGLFNRISWEYHSTGEVRMVVIDDEVGDEITTRFSYDAARRLQSVDSRVSSDPARTADQWVVYEFDAAGNTTSETHGSRDTPRNDLIVERVFDAHQRLDSMTRGEVTTDWDYNPDGTLAARTDGNQHTTTYRYDAFKRLVRTEHIGRMVTTIQYDTHGNALSVSDSGNRTTGFLHDDLGNRLQQDSPDSGITTYSYDEAGQVLSRTDANGQTTVFSYDAGGRLTSVDRPGLEDDVSFDFDGCENGAGRICAVTTGWGHTIEYHWNALGELTSVTTDEGQVGYTFGPAGTLRTLRYPSGRIVEFDNDGGGLPSRIRLRSPGLAESVLVDEIGYSPLGRPVSWRFANGLQTNIELDARHRPLQIDVGGGWAWQASGYDANDNLLGISSGALHANYAYDDLDRLVAASDGSASITYSYDGVGNLLTRTLNGITEQGTYEAGSNRIETLGARAYTLDPNGNPIAVSVDQLTSARYVWSAQNRLISVMDDQASSPRALYRYDGLGQRVDKVSGDTSRKFIYGPGGELLAEINGDGTVLHEYVYLDGVAVVDLGAVTSAPPPAGDTRLFDNGNAVAVGGNWQTRSSDAAENGSYIRNRKRTDRAVYWFVDDGPIDPGNYDVFVKWLVPEGEGTLTTYRVVTWNDNGGSDTHTVDVNHSNLSPGDWVLLGNFEFKGRLSGRWQRISLVGSDNDSGLEGDYLYADAVKLVPTADPMSSMDVKFLHGSHLGTPRLATDGAARIVWSAAYRPYGNTFVDEDPDGDGDAYELNLRFPGQYFDRESGLHYNYFRTYDPALGRYLTPDPAGLDAGLNTYLYAGANPLRSVDPLGLTVEGRWIESPRFNFEGAQVDDWYFVSPSFSEWGYLRFIRVHGRAWGYVNLDVRCTDNCEEWEIHDRVAIEAGGSVDIGPNLYALGIGFVARNPIAGLGANLALGGSALLNAEHHFLDLANQRAGPIISAALRNGPTLICLGSMPHGQ